MGRGHRRRRAAEYGAICLVVVAAALVLQPSGCNQTAHFALVKALHDGTPKIDRYAGETCDTAYIDGHYYAAKAPGLALLTEPWYAALRVVGLDAEPHASGLAYPEGMLALPRVATWQVSLWGATLAALLLLLLVRWAAELLVPGYGAAAAVLLGLGTLVLPFSTLFFAHVLSATLGMASFCLLLRHRRRGGRVAVPVAAGALVGVAVVVEFPLAILAVALAVYLGLGRGRLVPYAIGLAAGIVPLVAFDTWAFGSPFDLSYEHAVIEPGGSGHDVIGANDEGLFGLTVPSLRAAAELLASDKGLLVLTPLALAGVGGLLALRRGAARREANLALGVCGAFLLYNSAYFLPFGGWVPGPRFLIPALPFVALGIAAALRAMPLTTRRAGRAVGRRDGRRHARRASRGAGPGSRALAGALARIGLHRDGRHACRRRKRLGGRRPRAPGDRRRSRPRSVHASADRLQERDAGLALVAVFLWIVLAASGPELLELDRAVGQSTGLAAVVGLLLAAVASWLALRRYGIRAAAGAAVLGVLAVPGVASHSKWALLVVVGSAVIVAVTFVRLEPRT